MGFAFGMHFAQAARDRLSGVDLVVHGAHSYVKDNIDEVVEIVKLRLQFFAMWREDQLLNKAVFEQLHPSSKEWKK